MAWGFFKSKSQRTLPATQSRPTKSNSPSVNSPLIGATILQVVPAKPKEGPKSLHKAKRSISEDKIDPESNPLNGPVRRSNRAGIIDSSGVSSPVKRHSSAQSVRSVRSSCSIGSVGRSSSRSLRSNALSIKTRHIKAAHAAKRAAAAFISQNGGNIIKCYTCGIDMFDIRCSRCRTVYVPPKFHYSAASAAILANEIHGPAQSHLDRVYGGQFTTHNFLDNKLEHASDTSASISGAESLIGFLPETDIDFELATKKLDLELIKDLALSDEAGLLEEIVFECFSNPDAVANTFCKKSPHYAQIDVEGIPQYYIPNEITTEPSLLGPHTETKIDGELANNSIIDCNSVKKMYAILASVSSTTPMRGILQGAQAVLQVRKHAPLTENELIYISIILQCPAITECSMFTKITGPMQKLSRYAGLRSRARTIFEVCAGLIAHSDPALHPMFEQILASVDSNVFRKIVDLSNAYVSHRLSFDFHDKTRSNRPTKLQLVKHEWYSEDWRIIVVVKLLSLLNSANSTDESKLDNSKQSLLGSRRSSVLEYHCFYNTMVDFVDLKADYESWQLTSSYKNPKFCFCRYPFLLSVGAKAKVFEYAIQRQVNASIQRELFAVMMRPQQPPSMEQQQMQLASLRTFDLRVRRQHLLEDSIEQLSKWSASSKKRSIKVEFDGEPGIDAGGLKKEWFYLFFKQILDPALKVFQIDETSNYSWFGNHENIEYYKIAGMALGFALYNGITVDINLPLLLFKLLLEKDYDLNDLGTLWPEITQSLQSILDYEEDDFEDAFGLVFTSLDGTPLIPDGEKVNVTLLNRELYVELMVENIVNAKSNQLTSFKDSFHMVCGGNAMLLFQPEELELLARGDRKPIDVPALRSVTKYVSFGHRYEKANKEPVVQWFWEYFEKLDPPSQARLLQFVTSTDRAPATGMVQMRFSIRCLGGDSERLPIAHTCFNELCLYKYKTRKKLETKLSVAIVEYQGFGLK